MTMILNETQAGAREMQKVVLMIREMHEQLAYISEISDKYSIETLLSMRKNYISINGIQEALKLYHLHARIREEEFHGRT